ncbi:TetR/AcrR family transcriptional regulator [Glycomyces algeriensis]|uniref:TetR family transcriptional regulator n=1 Tax=Glycomyces algeriensis TaxID=256037 RepID=A0A9W6G676_9ACTN|nr:TetR/AcrR family transcriptional regulator [Glycomyces algeriensis]MDA1367061.1 helix-turn-helix domain containing protein [Glycomyces algeriensis]MDR7348552.1 AcrR family transcriptional regulator [Glycomyces algeriensis]GLI41256.1 TetR family transcriptional regulator [Glycomyces algeriensis]
MGRWEPNARGRLEEAALELYSERGFEQTTVAQIAERAGLTERTYFRHFADKREVLFGFPGQLHAGITEAVASAPADASALGAVEAALTAMGAVLQERREKARKRQAVIDENPELQERELIKMATMAALLTETLRARGIADSAAALAAETGIAVFKVAFERWIQGPDRLDLPTMIREALEELQSLAADYGTR